jgi:hypothetical protein
VTDIDEFGTDSTAITDFEGEVISSYFAVDENTLDPYIQLTLLTNMVDRPEWSERYKLATTKAGGKWLVIDDGAEIVADDGSVKVRDNGGYGKLINRCLTLASADLRAHGDSFRKAEIWLGSKWYWSQDSGSFPKKLEDGTTTTVTWAKNYPSKFLGYVDVPPAAPVSPLDVLDDVDPDTVVALRDLAHQYDHDNWIDEVMDRLPAVRANARVIGALGNAEGLYKALRGQ